MYGKSDIIPVRDMSVIDLFCGAGGLSDGFRQAGFHVLAGQDYNDAAGKTFTSSHNEAKFIGGPIQQVTPAQLLKPTGLKRGQIDVIVGGPPCQGYSVYNHNRGENDPRAGLFKEYLRIVDGIKPRWLVMENVTGITSISNGKIVNEILSGIKELGYRVEMKILKAEEYGVPQERRRIFFIATRTELPIIFPEPTHGSKLNPFVTIWDAISDLPELNNGEKNNNRCYVKKPVGNFQKYIRSGSSKIFNHNAQKLSGINEERMSFIPPGGSWRDIPIHLLPDGMKHAKRSDHTKRYGRPRKDDLSCTILTKCDIHWGAFIHPEQNRAFTVREAARLQSFQDTFEFFGNTTEQYTQVGNAVPPLLGKNVAKAILLSESYQSGNAYLSDMKGKSIAA